MAWYLVEHRLNFLYLYSIYVLLTFLVSSHLARWSWHTHTMGSHLLWMKGRW